MISQQPKPNNSLTNYPNKRPNRKHATLAQCIKVGGARGARATVLQKLCHYDAGTRFDIDGQKMTAPTTDMLIEELGLSRSTIQKAIRDLERMCVIEVKVRHFNRSPRRYVRVLVNPAEIETPPQRPKPKAVSNPAPTSHEPMTGPDDQTVHTKKEKKKKIQKKTQPIQEECVGVLVPQPLYNPPKYSQKDFCQALAQQGGKTGSASAAQSSDPLWQPKGMFERLELKQFLQQAKAHSYKIIDALAERRDRDMHWKICWQRLILARWEREFRRGRASGKVQPADIGKPWPRYFK